MATDSTETNILPKHSYWTGRLGSALMAFALLIIVFTYYPVLKEEGRYFFTGKNKGEAVTRAEAERLEQDGQKVKALIPQDENFGIVIPKIGANSPVVADVDWKDEPTYQRALTKGVAHAKDTAKPGEKGNIFLFAHSGVDFYEALQYNAAFYLINKLQEGDEIDIFYQGHKYTYAVTEKKTVPASNLSSILDAAQKETLTLMTCWPAGTTFSRLLVIAERTQ